jgi:hypothetical protein
MVGEWILDGAQAEIAYRTAELRKAGRRATVDQRGRSRWGFRARRATSVEIPEQTRRKAVLPRALTSELTR